MRYKETTETVVAKKRKPDVQPEPEPDPEFESEDCESGRVEFLAPPEWIERVNQTAKSLGLSRSAFIRFACNRMMRDEE